MDVRLSYGADVMGRKRSKNPRREEIMKYVRARRAIERAEFYADGGEMVRARGLRLVQQDKKKQANKRACRKPVKLGD